MKIYICVGPFVWGKGFTPEAAIAEATRHHRRELEEYTIFETTDPNARVKPDGGFCWNLERDPQGPREICFYTAPSKCLQIVCNPLPTGSDNKKAL